MPVGCHAQSIADIAKMIAQRSDQPDLPFPSFKKKSLGRAIQAERPHEPAVGGKDRNQPAVDVPGHQGVSGHPPQGPESASAPEFPGPPAGGADLSEEAAVGIEESDLAVGGVAHRHRAVGLPCGIQGPIEFMGWIPLGIADGCQERAPPPF